MSQQIQTQIDVTLTGRNRMSAFFRIILLIPMMLFVESFAATSTNYFSGSGWNGYSVGFIALPVMLSLVVRQVYPSYLLAFNSAFLSLTTRVDAYIFLLTDEYPSIEENEIVTVTFPTVDAKALNRWLPLVKWLLAIPLYVLGIFYALYALILTVVGWVGILFTGNYPEKCAEVVVGTIAYWNRVAGYALLLVTDEYPTFSL